MIENIDSRGYLDMPLEYICKELRISIDLGQETLEMLQNLEPYGIGARDLKECLKIQLMKIGMLDEKLEETIDNYLDLIADNKINILAKNLNIMPKEAQDLGDTIKRLKPKPARGGDTGEEVKFLIPDATIRKIDGEYFVIVNDGVIPRLSISNIYKDILNNKEDKETENYVKEKLNSAMFLIKSIEQRKSTLVRVLEKTVEKQKEYFDNEDKKKPLSDQIICGELNKRNLNISRRTVAKYREEIGIKSSSKRKRIE